MSVGRNNQWVNECETNWMRIKWQTRHKIKIRWKWINLIYWLKGITECEIKEQVNIEQCSNLGSPNSEALWIKIQKFKWVWRFLFVFWAKIPTIQKMFNFRARWTNFSIFVRIPIQNQGFSPRSETEFGSQMRTLAIVVLI